MDDLSSAALPPVALGDGRTPASSPERGLSALQRLLGKLDYRLGLPDGDLMLLAAHPAEAVLGLSFKLSSRWSLFPGEIWFLCRRYDAETAERWRLVNRVVPAASLRAEVRRWADEILALSPTALRFVKQSFNADSEHLAGVGQLAFSGLESFIESDEAREGVHAFAEKRDPDFTRFRAGASST